MDRFAALNTFILVAHTGGFSAAARELGLATSSVARLIDALEEKIGAPLLNRSTRKVTLTEAGRAYYEKAVKILSDLEEADNTAAARSSEPAGLLRISAPVTFTNLHIAPLLPELTRLYPRLEFDMRLSDATVNLVDESIDVAIRIGAMEQQANLIARKLSMHERYICASPTYLAQHGRPVLPEDLMKHNCLQFAYAAGRQIWHLQSGARMEEVQVSGNLSVNNSETLRQAALRSMGIALLPDWLVHADIQAGNLIRLMEKYQVNPGAMDIGIYAVYQLNRRGSSKIKAFTDALSIALLDAQSSRNKHK
ncbi:LysR family transcriptional regulator [Undibacterium terreum]|uniref:LysR family transcriptional regulator n=1 Tax=Undibacterium terreum TaxID=1224302 RepID=A0A916U2Z2_9BURK|nr:LysR family transcriptional regulator [Undibacterium terreum]GGC57632.1 LysR family transcriptional regulator [Undibacterium terreum]